jgi:hypothetical protein
MKQTSHEFLLEKCLVKLFKVESPDDQVYQKKQEHQTKQKQERKQKLDLLSLEQGLDTSECFSSKKFK